MTKRAQQKEQTSIAILNASLSVFAIKDYNSATFSDISKIAKVTNGLIVQRFGSKEALYGQLIEQVILNKAPDFSDTNSLDDALLKIISFVKSVGGSIECLRFAYVAYNTFNDLSERTQKLLSSVYYKTKLNEVFTNAIKAEKIKFRDGFEAFKNFFTGCCEITINYLENGAGVASNDVYLQLFKKSGALHDARFSIDSKTSMFDSISDKSLELYNISTWYADIGDNDEPELHFPKEVLRRAGLPENIDPKATYKYIVDRVDPEDKHIVRDAIRRMYLGEYVEFEFRWSSPKMTTIFYRFSGKRTGSVNGINRFEGILQNISSFRTLRNRNKTRDLLLNLIAPDYEYVTYVHLGATPDDDYVEDYKTSDFLSKITDNWGNTNNFMDRLDVLINKTFVSKDRLRFAHKDNRKIVIDALKKSDRFKTTFEIKNFGIIYDYEIVFYPDREDEKELRGLICGIRMANGILTTMRNKFAHSFVNRETENEDLVAKTLLANHDATFILNLNDHSFEIYKESAAFKTRNDYVPDFESFIQTYIKRDVHFEDAPRLLELTKVDNIKNALHQKKLLSIPYRDISTGKPLHYLMRITGGENNLAAMIITNINNEFVLAKQNTQKLEEELRKEREELHKKNALIENTNSLIIDLLGDVIECTREEGVNDLHKFRHLSFILGTQLMEDHPELGLTRKDVARIGEASILHDIGKIAIPDSILYKKGKLTNEEFEVIKTHIVEDEKILSKLRGIYDKFSYELIIDICRYHHERFDGSGYPEGLVGDEIPVSAQIVGLIDAFNALVSMRTYRDAYEVETAFKMIESGECGSFNPDIVDSFMRCKPSIIACLEETFKSDEPRETALGGYKNKTIINQQTLPLISSIAEKMPGGFFIYKNDAQGSILYFNDFMVKYFDCESRDEFAKYVNNSFKGIVHNDDYDKTVNVIAKQIAESKDQLDHLKYRIVTKHGETKVLEHFGHITHGDTYGDVSYAFVRELRGKEEITNYQHEYRDEDGRSTYLVRRTSGKDMVKTLEGTRILIVDDNDLSRYMTKDSLEEEGAFVSDFASGEDALRNIKMVKPYDIILIDLIMPGMSGVDLTRAIRDWESDKATRVPIVVVTGEVESALAKQCLTEGANGVMSKPLMIPELARLLIVSMKEHQSMMVKKLTSTIEKANTDALTHVKNRTAYAERLEQIEKAIRANKSFEFGIVGADINNLKIANDTNGHDVGDIYIKNCCKMLCDVFSHSPVYRTGGDEFAVILEGEDLANYKELIETLRKVNLYRSSITDYEKGRAHVAYGCAVFDPNIDDAVDDVIKRADAVMYKNKQIEKKRVAGSFAKIR